jgi:hypothetical protein
MEAATEGTAGVLTPAEGRAAAAAATAKSGETAVAEEDTGAVIAAVAGVTLAAFARTEAAEGTAGALTPAEDETGSAEVAGAAAIEETAVAAVERTATAEAVEISEDEMGAESEPIGAAATEETAGVLTPTEDGKAATTGGAGTAANGIAADSPPGKRSSAFSIGEIGKADISPIEGITNFSAG